MLDTISKLVAIGVGVTTIYELLLVAKKTKLEIKKLEKENKDGSWGFCLFLIYIVSEMNLNSYEYHTKYNFNHSCSHNYCVRKLCTNITKKIKETKKWTYFKNI